MKPVTLTESIDEARYGEKAAQLAAAIRAGLPVPGGVALPVGFVEDVASGQPATTASTNPNDKATPPGTGRPARIAAASCAAFPPYTDSSTLLANTTGFMP